MNLVAEKFGNYTFHLLGGGRVGGWGEKAGAGGKDEPTSDKWLLSELRIGGQGCGWGRGGGLFLSWFSFGILCQWRKKS